METASAIAGAGGGGFWSAAERAMTIGIIGQEAFSYLVANKTSFDCLTALGGGHAGLQNKLLDLVEGPPDRLGLGWNYAIFWQTSRARSGDLVLGWGDGSCREPRVGELGNQGRRSIPSDDDDDAGRQMMKKMVLLASSTVFPRAPSSQNPTTAFIFFFLLLFLPEKENTTAEQQRSARDGLSVEWDIAVRRRGGGRSPDLPPGPPQRSPAAPDPERRLAAPGFALRGPPLRRRWRRRRARRLLRPDALQPPLILAGPRQPQVPLGPDLFFQPEWPRREIAGGVRCGGRTPLRAIRRVRAARFPTPWAAASSVESQFQLRTPCSRPRSSQMLSAPTTSLLAMGGASSLLQLS